MTSPANHARDSIILALQADATVTSFIPADRIYPNKHPNMPVKPYSRLGPVDAERETLSCWRGANIDGAVHIFVAVTPAIPDPESFAHDAADAMALVIDGLPDAFHDRTLVLVDSEEADQYHAVIYYRFAAVQPI